MKMHDSRNVPGDQFYDEACREVDELTPSVPPIWQGPGQKEGLFRTLASRGSTRPAYRCVPTGMTHL